ncbi:hypothetical protein BCR43DRAFT_505164 [Syncephalastrum racemosum]|uniref:F-box domain-containing protein n=1 Tax=Syncephalastrum racemosum TaxID=13706 RepID=A0A1X2HD63_SYNRA|nr:hypothetical protein BCR43DRAFT_505164 [Syncephalastrum racemosum]
MQKDAQLATTTPGTSSKCFALARRYWMQSQPEAAYEALSSILAEHDDHYEARALRLQVGRVLKRKETEEDAHKLLTLGPDAGLAYLYFGQSMMAKGKQADAIGLFEKAQRRVASNDPHRREIQQLLHTLHRTEINILIRLPPDILCLVFSFLPFAARLRCAAVSRIWRHALTTVSILWRDLDLTSDDAEDDGVIVALERSARWAEGEIRSLRIALSAKVLRALARQDLHHLHHVDFTPPGRRMIEERSLVQTMQIIAASWHHVSVSGRTIPIGAFTAALCLHCPRIKSLVIERGALMDTVDNVDTDATIDSLRTLILLQSYDTEASDIQNLLRIVPKSQLCILMLASPLNLGKHGSTWPNSHSWNILH